MRAVDGKDLKLIRGDATHPTGNIPRGSVPRMDGRVTVGRQSRLPGRILFERPQRDPFHVVSYLSARRRSQQIADNGRGEEYSGDGIERDPE